MILVSFLFICTEFWLQNTIRRNLWITLIHFLLLITQRQRLRKVTLAHSSRSSRLRGAIWWYVSCWKCLQACKASCGKKQKDVWFLSFLLCSLFSLKQPGFSYEGSVLLNLSNSNYLPIETTVNTKVKQNFSPCWLN